MFVCLIYHVYCVVRSIEDDNDDADDNSLTGNDDDDDEEEDKDVKFETEGSARQGSGLLETGPSGKEFE